MIVLVMRAILITSLNIYQQGDIMSMGFSPAQMPIHLD